MNHLTQDPKALFDLPPARNGKSVIELRSLTHGIPPKAVKQNLEQFNEEWKSRGVDAWNTMEFSQDVFLVGDESDEDRQRNVGWWNLPEIIGDRFISRLINAPTGTCIMLPNATQIMFSILSCQELHQPGRRKVICTNGEFPSVLHSIQNANRQFKAYPENIRSAVQFDHRIIEMPKSVFDPERIIAEIDDQTALVIFSHVGFIRGERVTDDAIKAVAKACQKHGVLVAIDGYHAIGSHITNVEDIEVDFYFGGLLKEGCGSSGNCFLYVRKGLDVHPSLSGWFADKQPFAFAQSPEKNPSVPRRFLTGTTPIAPLYHGVEGLKIMLNMGLENVSVDILDKAKTMVSIFVNGDITVISPQVAERMSAMVVLEVNEADLLREYLEHEHNILTDARQNTYLRLAAHIYNSKEEVEKAANIIVQSLNDRAYLSYEAPQRVGPVT